jgi:hypothetical protein
VSGEAWSSVAAIVSALALAVSTLGVARINATKADVGEAKQQAADANTAAVQARDYAAPTGNGYAAETRAALDRIERKVDGLSRDLLHHLQDHSRSGLDRH